MEYQVPRLFYVIARKCFGLCLGFADIGGWSVSDGVPPNGSRWCRTGCRESGVEWNEDVLGAVKCKKEVPLTPCAHLDVEFPMCFLTVRLLRESNVEMSTCRNGCQFDREIGGAWAFPRPN